MNNFQKETKISIISAVILIIIVICIFSAGIFRFTDFKNAIYSVFFIIFYLIAFIIPFVIFNFACSIKKQAETLDFENNAENKNNVFSKIYFNYKKTFLYSKDNILELSEKTRTNADLYFNADELCEVNFSISLLPILKIITGTFVGLGILGTFIGFTAAVPSDSISDVQELDPLFKGLHTAFNTSIVGVFSSIFYNFLVIQPLLKLLNQNSKELSDKLDERHFVTDTEAMEKLASIVQGTLDTVQNNTKDLAEKFKDSSAEMFNEAIAEGKEALNKEMASTALKLTEIAEILKETPIEIANLNEKLKDFADELQPSTAQLQDCTKKFSVIAKQFENLPEEIKNAHNEFKNSEEELVGKMQDSVMSLREAISVMRDSSDTIHESIRNTLEKIQNTKDEIDTLLESSKLNNQEITKNLRDAISQYNFIKDETKNMLSSYLKVDQSLKSIFEQIKNQFENYSNGVGVALTKYMDGFAEGTQNYTAGFKSSVEELKNAFASIEPIFEKIENSEEKLSSLPDEINEILNKVQSVKEK